MRSPIQSITSVRAIHPTYRPRRSLGAHLAGLLLATVAAQSACDSPTDNEAEELAVAPASLDPDAFSELEAAFAEADPDEQDSELESAFIEAHIEAMGPGTLTLSLPPPAASTTPYPAHCYGKATEYQVTIKTGNMLYAGTDAMVSYKFRGDHAGQSKWTVWMDQSGVGRFERGHVDPFNNTFKSLGALDKLVLMHNNTGASAGWYVDWVTVHDTCSDIEWHANINRWLDKKPGLSASAMMYEF